MKCLNCDNPAKDGSRFCCGRCRIIWYRIARNHVIASYGGPGCKCTQCITPDGNVAHVGVVDAQKGI